MNADNAAIHIEEWAARITRTDGAIRLQGICREPDKPSQTYHQRTSQIKASGMAQRQHPISTSGRFKFGRADVWPGVGVGDFHQPGIVLQIDPQGFSTRSFSVGKCEADIQIRLSADMTGSENQTIFRNDHATPTSVSDFHGHHRGRHPFYQLLYVTLD